MKKTLMTLTLLTAFSLLVNRAYSQKYQPFPDKCALWEVYRCWYFYQPDWHDKYTLTMDGSDTLYNGDVYKKINIIEHHLPGTKFDSLHPPVFFGGLRESGKKIYIFQIWASVDTLPHLIYDFTHTNLGDTIYTNVLSGTKQLYAHVVKSVDSVLVGSNYHKRLYLQDTGSIYNTEYWIEGIGSSWGLPWASFWSITDNTYDLSCYNTINQVVYQNPSPTFGMCTGTLPSVSCKASSACDSVSTCHLNKLLVQTGNLLKASQDSAKYQWIDCSSMLAIAGDTGQTFTATKNGSYAVIIEKGKCIDTSSCAQVSGLGINSHASDNFRIYPVPSKGRIYVDLGTEMNSVDIELMDVQGQIIQSWSFDKMVNTELELLPPRGIYLLSVKTERETSIFRIIKE